MITIVLADDHKILRQGVKVLLETESDFKIVGEAGDGLVAVQELRRLKPDVLVADINMPGLNGIDLTRETQKVSPNTKVIILSMHTAEVYVREALLAGAKGYVVKESGLDDLARAIREALASRCFLSPILPANLRAYSRLNSSEPLESGE